MITVGAAAPSADVAVMQRDTLLVFDLPDLLVGRTLLIGMPGAFTPVCSSVHLPSVLEAAPDLLEHVDQILVLTPDNPWVLDAWRQTMDVPGHIRFVSDGSGAFTDACGMRASVEDRFLGDCSRRYAMLTRERTVQAFWLERSIFDVTVTSGDALKRQAAAWAMKLVAEVEKTAAE